MTTAADPTAPLLILGSHRSGTSAVAGMFSALGLSMGELLPPGPDNPRGYYETAEILRAHEDLLRQLEHDWVWPPHRFSGNAVDSTRLANAIESIETDRPWGVKDPRSMFLLPAWTNIVPRFRMVGVVRDPASIAKSLLSRNNFSPEQAHVIVDRYVRRLHDLWKYLDFPIVDFDADPATTAERVRAIAAFHGLEGDAPGQVFESSLRHHGGHDGSDFEHVAELKAAASATIDSLGDFSREQVHEALDRITEQAAGPNIAMGPGLDVRSRELRDRAAIRQPGSFQTLVLHPSHSTSAMPVADVDPEISVLAKNGPPDGRFGIVVGAGVLEETSNLRELLAELDSVTSVPATVALDGLLVTAQPVPDTSWFEGAAVASHLSGEPYHHHVAEIYAAVSSTQFIVESISPLRREGGRSVVMLTKGHGTTMSADFFEGLSAIDGLHTRIAQLEGDLAHRDNLIHDLTLERDAAAAASTAVERLVHEVSVLDAERQDLSFKLHRAEIEVRARRSAYENLLRDDSGLRHWNRDLVQEVGAQGKAIAKLEKDLASTKKSLEALRAKVDKVKRLVPSFVRPVGSAILGRSSKQ